MLLITRSVMATLQAAPVLESQQPTCPLRSLEPQRLTTQWELLKYLELVYAQQQVAAESAKELEAKRARQNDELQRLRTGGPAEKPPYSFLLSDSFGPFAENAKKRS
jgi:hypothetical protein